MDKKLQLIVVFLLIVFSVINIGFPVIKNWGLFTEKFDPKLYEKKYNHSQYVIPQSKNPISDEELDSYAGYRYATGLNPVLINSDHPPLGKYLIGWITVLTGNNRISSIVFALGNIIILSSIIYYLSSSVLITSLGVFFLSQDTMFIDQIIHSPILDIIQVFFLLLYFFFFILWLKKQRIILLFLLGVVLGCFCSIKLYFPAFVILTTIGVFLVLIKKPLRSILLVLVINIILGFITYTATYFVFFIKGNNLRSFLGAQKWIFLFWKNNSVQSSKFIGDALTLILFNQWKVWWGDKPYIQFEHWSILWPVFFLAGIISAFLVLIKFRKKHTLLFFSLWTILITVYLSLLPISPRYLMLLYFPIYILIPLVIQLVLKSKIKN